MDSKDERVRIPRAMFTTGLACGINYGIILVLTPYITETIGTHGYGFVSLAKQFAQYAAIITTALNTFASRYIGIAYHAEDKGKANTYFSSVFWGDVILASGILAVAGSLILYMERLIHIPPEIVKDVKILFLLIFLSFWVTTVCSVFGCAGYIKNRVDLTGIFKALSNLVNALLLIVTYVFFPARIFYVGVGTLAAALVVAGSDAWIAKKYTPDLRIRRKDFSFAAVKRLVMDGCWSSLKSVGNLLNSGLDLLVCNQLLSSLAMGQMAIAKNMSLITGGLCVIVDHAFFPAFLKCYADNNRQGLLEKLKLSMKVSGLLNNLIFAGFAALGMAYYRLWIPEQDIPVIYELTVITMLTCIPSGAVHPLYYIYTLTLQNRFPCLVTIAGGIVNVAGMYILIRHAGMGVYAVAWTTAAVMAVINFVTNPLYMAHVLQLPLTTFYPDIARNVLSCLALAAVFKGLACLYTPSSWISLVICALCYLCVGIPIHLVIVCNKQQWKGLREMFA